MYTEHYSAISHSQIGFRSIKESVSHQVLFWLWDRKLSKQYKHIMKNKKTRSCSYDMKSEVSDA